MQFTRILGRITATSIICALLVSCTEGPGGTTAGFKKQYLLARSNLEKGKIQQALSGYTTLAQERGPFETRILLELGHAYLRVADFGAAQRTVQALSKADDTRIRAAALAVIGTAEQEMARARIAAGDRGTETKAHLQRAQTALTTMLKLHPDMDPTRGMATRVSQISSELKKL